MNKRTANIGVLIFLAGMAVGYTALSLKPDEQELAFSLPAGFSADETVRVYSLNNYEGETRAGSRAVFSVPPGCYVATIGGDHHAHERPIALECTEGKFLSDDGVLDSDDVDLPQ